MSVCLYVCMFVCLSIISSVFIISIIKRSPTWDPFEKIKIEPERNYPITTWGANQKIPLRWEARQTSHDIREELKQKQTRVDNAVKTAKPDI